MAPIATTASGSSAGWQNIYPGVYSRALDELELYYLTNAKVWFGTGHTANAITAHVDLNLHKSFDELEQQSIRQVQKSIVRSLKYAWKQIRFECPHLAAKIECDQSGKPLRRVYQVPDDQALKNWMVRTFILDRSTRTETSQDLLNIDMPVGEAAIFVSQHETKVSWVGPGFEIGFDIIFRCGKDVMDEMGAYSVLHKLLKHTCDVLPIIWMFSPPHSAPIIFGTEHQNLAPPLRTLLNLPSSPRHTGAELATIRGQTPIDRKSAISITHKRGGFRPGSTLRAALHFTVEETSAIFAAARLQGVFPSRISQVFHAAIALGLQNLQMFDNSNTEGFIINAGRRRYVSGDVIMDLRRFCKEPYDTPEPSMLACHSISVPAYEVVLSSALSTLIESRFRSALMQIKFFFNSKPDLAAVPLHFAARTPEWPTSEYPEIPDPSPTPGISLSGQGFIDQILSPLYPIAPSSYSPNPAPLEISNPWVTSNELSPGLGLTLTTWNGEFCLRIAYNEVFHEDTDIKKFLKHVYLTIMNGLCLKEDWSIGERAHEMEGKWNRVDPETKWARLSGFPKKLDKLPDGSGARMNKMTGFFHTTS